MRKFLAMGGPAEGKFVELEHPYGNFFYDEDGRVWPNRDSSYGEWYSVRSITLFGRHFWFAIHESLWKTKVLEDWALAALEWAYKEDCVKKDWEEYYGD